MTDITDTPPNSPPKAQRLAMDRPRKRRGRPSKKPNSGDITAIERTNVFTLPPISKSKHGDKGEQVASGIDGNSVGRAHLTLSASPLTNEIKHRIVELFACFHTHKQVEGIIASEFGIKPTPNQLTHYDPQRTGCQMSSRLRDYYSAVRKRYVEDAKDVAISHQAHRLRRLEMISDAALASKDYGNAIKALEVAAKEMGGLLPTPVEVRHTGIVSHVHGTVEEARAEVAMRLQALADKVALPAPEPEAQPALYDVVEDDCITDDLTD